MKYTKAVEMRFRRLTTKELDILEKDFISFLASNTITAGDWEKLKVEENEQAEDLINMFSDIVLETSLKKVHFVEHCSKSELMFFKCNPKEIILIGLRSKNSEIDLSEMDLGQLKTEMTASFSTQKKYSKNREEEVFDMLNQGCSISDGKLFEALMNMKNV